VTAAAVVVVVAVISKKDRNGDKVLAPASPSSHRDPETGGWRPAARPSKPWFPRCVKKKEMCLFVEPFQSP